MSLVSVSFTYVKDEQDKSMSKMKVICNLPSTDQREIENILGGGWVRGYWVGWGVEVTCG